MKANLRVFNPAEGYDLAASHYDEKEAYLNSFEQGELLGLCGDVRSKKVLDVGAGTGRISVPLSRLGAIVTALDVSSEMLQLLHCKEPMITTVVGDAEELPFADESFDLVIATFLVVHLRDLNKFFDEVYRVLKNGGVFIFTNINQKEPPEVKMEKGNGKIESYYHRPEQVREDLKELAFSIDSELILKVKETWVNQIIKAIK